MPLSEQEQRLLEEMERSLYHNDADFVAGSSGRHGRPTYSMIVTGVLVGIVGVATLIAGVAVRLPVVGVIGFILMFAGVLIALTPPRRSSTGRPRSTATADASGTFRQSAAPEWENGPDDQAE
ncbi:MAG TPA: DUF3040 domain-containing protein [Galbitalea sp.]|jgi:hypothetical protein